MIDPALLAPIVNSWIAWALDTWDRRSKGMAPDQSPDSERFIAFQTVMGLCEQSASHGLTAILAILKADAQWRILSLLSAGPLQVLLQKHGDEAIGPLETSARNDPEVARLMGGLASDGITPAVWERVTAVMDTRGWDDNPEIA